MDVKEVVQRGYDLFGSGDMETFFGEIVHDDITWTFPGEEGKHPLAGVHKGKENFIANMSKIPEYWDNFMVTPQVMTKHSIHTISSRFNSNKYFVPL